MLTLPHAFRHPLCAALLFATVFCLPSAFGQSAAGGQGLPAAQSGSIASAADEWPSVVIGFIGQSRYMPQTVAALAGAIDAARELGPRHRMHVSVVHRSPEAATVPAQNAALRELFVDGTSGVLIHPVDAPASTVLLALLDRQRVPVVTFGTPALIEGISAAVMDDEDAIGDALAAEAFRLLDARRGRRGGGIAVLAGPRDTEPYAARSRAAVRQLQRSASYADYGTFYNEPNMDAALHALQSVTRKERNERLSAWISVGGWPLEGLHAQLPQAEGLSGFVVAGGLPQMLPYLEQGSVYSLVSPDYYGLGYEAMRQALLAQDARRTAAETANAAAETASTPAEVTGEAIVAREVTRTKVLPRIIRRDNLNAYAEQWANWLAQSM